MRFFLSAFFFVFFALLFAPIHPAQAAPTFGSGAVAGAKFRQAVPPYRYEFPRDHNAHPQFATEWWYYTGHLTSENGRKFGYQLTWFRTAIAPAIRRKSKWATRDILFAHFAITDETGQKFYFTDTIGRSNLGICGADTNSKTPRIWCNDWVLQFSGPRGQTQTLRARGNSDARGTKGAEMALSLRVSTTENEVLNGVNGVSQKSAGVGRASHYYSYTDLAASGTLQIGRETFRVRGTSWLDREWGSSQMAPSQVGWDWFSLRLSDGRQLMLYQLRLKNGGVEPYSSGTLTEKNGRFRHLKRRDFELIAGKERYKSPESGGNYPISWKIRVPSARISLDVRAVLPEQELIPRRSGRNLSYWEGAISGAGKGLRAQGYLEMTGYGSSLAGVF